MRVMRAWACGLRTMHACTIPGRRRSSVYVACPVISRGSSRRRMLAPKILLTAMVVAPLPDGCAAQLARGVLDRVHNVLVAGAAAEVAFQPFADLRLGGIGVPAQQLE